MAIFFCQKCDSEKKPRKSGDSQECSFAQQFFWVNLGAFLALIRPRMCWQSGQFRTFFWQFICQFRTAFFSRKFSRNSTSPRPTPRCALRPSSPHGSPGGGVEPGPSRQRASLPAKEPAQEAIKEPITEKKQRKGVLSLYYVLLLFFSVFWVFVVLLSISLPFWLVCLTQGVFVCLFGMLMSNSPSCPLVQRLPRWLRKGLAVNTRRGVTLPPPCPHTPRKESPLHTKVAGKIE